MHNKAWFGYNPRRVKRYMNRLDREAGFLESRQREQTNAFLSKQAELRRQIEEAERKLAEIETMEANIKQWIQRNRTSG